MFHVIILNWNGYEETVECVDSLISNVRTPYDVTVVDNDSKSGDFELLTSKYSKTPWIEIVKTSSNL